MIDLDLWAGRWWKSPKRLGYLLDAGTITPTEYTLVCWVGHSGGDVEPPPVARYAELATKLGCSSKTITRALEHLRTLGLLVYTSPGRGSQTPFPIRLGPALHPAGHDEEWTPERTQDPPSKSELVSILDSDTNSPSAGREPASDAALTSDAASDTAAAPPPVDVDIDGDRSRSSSRAGTSRARAPAEKPGDAQQLDEHDPVEAWLAQQRERRA